MEKVVKQLEEAGITLVKFDCGYYLIALPVLYEEHEEHTIRWLLKFTRLYIILDRFHGYNLIGTKDGEVKYFRTISELIEYVKK